LFDNKLFILLQSNKIENSPASGLVQSTFIRTDNCLHDEKQDSGDDRAHENAGRVSFKHSGTLY
jgi:hypothetical protein